MPGVETADKAIMKDIVKMTSRPRHVIRLVDEFFEENLSKHYISIHWRYNDNDWYHGGCNKDKDRDKLCKLCNYIM